MKFVLDERVKHRLTGLIVILSIAIIFVPSIVKKSNNHFEENINLSVNLPAKPKLPKVVVANRGELFHAIKTAKVIVPAPIEKVRAVQIAKAEPISLTSKVPTAPFVVKKAEIAEVSKQTSSSPSVKNAQFSIQIASFTNPVRAQNLVNQLRSKGYVASYNRFNGVNGLWYKVVVGQLKEANQAKELQKQLLVSMRLNGFVIKTKVT